MKGSTFRRVESLEVHTAEGVFCLGLRSYMRYMVGEVNTVLFFFIHFSSPEEIQKFSQIKLLQALLSLLHDL